jgi:hypothetical protein
MIYTLFVWTVVAASAETHSLAHKHMDWRPLATVEAMQYERDQDTMLAKCAGIARELSIPRDRYRCIRTK